VDSKAARQGREAAAQRGAAERSAGPRSDGPRSEPQASEGPASGVLPAAGPQGPPAEERGVHNPRVVDLIRLDAAADEVELLMLETRPWGSDPQQLPQLQAKFNSYLGYVQTGALARDYPQYAGKPVRFRLDCASAPAGDAAAMLGAMRGFAESEGIAFAIELSC